jgi:hypothetical protein
MEILASANIYDCIENVAGIVVLCIVAICILRSNN